jgi:hypothetical protein
MSDIAFQNKYLVAKFLDNEITSIMYCEWKDDWLSRDDQELKIALTFCHKIASEKQVKVLISSCVELATVSLDVDSWISEWWYPTCYENGILAEILIDSEDFMGQIAVSSFMENNESKLMNPRVQSLDEAKILAKKIISQNSNSAMPS